MSFLRKLGTLADAGDSAQLLPRFLVADEQLCMIIEDSLLFCTICLMWRSPPIPIDNSSQCHSDSGSKARGQTITQSRGWLYDDDFVNATLSQEFERERARLAEFRRDSCLRAEALGAVPRTD